VDLANITSKYIGETEKNLARLLARAERTEAVLLFDEADSLFGKRTDVRESNDRFANAQTNYLLQRIETFDSIALLTSNSRGRFDTAFSRRLDQIIEFPAPAPAERRALWQAHLGDHHALGMQELNLLAGQCDFPGGQIRNVVLAAAVAARARSEPIDLAKIQHALAAEYRKAGRPLPSALSRPAKKPDVV
jgi:SpoVK/Ycf46/Vps4 family AAA+-type ATPase